MRRIITRESRDKKLKRNQLIIGIALIGLMVSSTLGFAFINKTNSSNDIEEIKYKGVRFVRDLNGYWNFNIDGIDFLTKYNPENTEAIDISTSLNLQNYVNKPLYFIGDSGDHFAEIDRNLRDRFVTRISGACLSGEECLEDFPIKSCSEDNIIIIKEDAENERIYQEEGCVFITASYANQVRYADAFLFSLLGI